MASFSTFGGVCVLAFAAASAHGQNVYVFSTGNANVDAAYTTALTSKGFNVTIGRQWSTFDGTENLAGFQAVIMNHGSNWGSSGEQVSVAGQQQLVNYVNAGGGLITTEWIVYNFGITGAYGTLAPIFPVTYGGTWNSSANTTLTRAANDPIMDAGLASTFSIPLVSFSGTESRLLAKPGATMFYKSSNMSTVGVDAAAVAGWNVGLGRAASLSSMPGVASLTDANYAQLVANTVNWVIPAPGAMGVFAVAGLAAARRRRV